MRLKRNFRWDRYVYLLASTIRIPAFLGIVATIVAGISDSAFAEDPFEELRLRIEQLEEDNRQLRMALAPKAPSVLETSAVVPPAPEEEEEVTDEEKRIGGMVEKYLLRRDADDSQEDAAQDQYISTLQGSVAGILSRLNAKTPLPNVTMMGVFQTDAGLFDQDHNSKLSYGHIANGIDFRRARLAAKATVTDSTNGFFQMDFAFFGRPTFTDVWVEQKEIPGIGTGRIGQWKQPFSLEVVSSFRYTTFIERSVLFQAFTPFRHIGAGIYNNSDDLKTTWAASVFGANNDQYGGSTSLTGGIAFCERFTYCPWYDEASKGREYVHLGFGHYFNAPTNQITKFATIPEMYIGQQSAIPGAANTGTSGQPTPNLFNGTPFFVNTGNIGVVDYNVVGAELLYVEGPFTLQSEAMLTMVNQKAGVGGVTNPNGGTMANLPGCYVSGSYFLTGEHRPYDRKSGTIERVVPFHNFAPWKGDGCGWGAWEVASRWSWIDLNSQNIRGGQMNDFTQGLNWYLTPYWKIQFNYIYSASNYSYTGNTTAAGAAGASTNTPSGTFFGNHTNMYDLRCQLDF